MALLPEPGILKTEVVFPAIILGVPLCSPPPPLSVFVSLVGKTKPARPVNIEPMLCVSSLREIRPVSMFEPTIKKLVN